ncbi:MAG: hypothetical protein N2645_01480 [Clostridia bacterium]|nr:hypothetical protein [Clostridia bacterium]
MEFLKTAFKKFLYIFTILSASVSLLISASTININSTLTDSKFHEKLFQENNILSHTHTVVNDSMEGFINNLKQTSPQGFESHKEVFSMLQKSVTPEMVKLNLDSIREGLFKYFKGEKIFLPDIYLNPSPQKQPSSGLDDNSPSQVLSKIDKINLSTILLYINRNDIIDDLHLLKFSYYTTHILPGFFLLIFFLLFIIALVLSKNLKEILRWASLSFTATGVLGLLIGLSLYIYSTHFLPNQIYPLTMSVPLPQEVIISYLKGALLPIAFFHILFSCILIAVSVILFYLPKLLPKLFYDRLTQNEKPLNKFQKRLKYTVYIGLFILIVITIGFRVNDVKKDFELNDFTPVLSKLINRHAVTQVIFAKDEAVYSLHVKLIDKSSDEKPIANVKVNVNGKSNTQKKSFDESKTTDESGIAKFTLDNGTFRIMFIPEYFPQEYQLPSPLFVDLETAGTTLITIRLDNASEKEKWGVAEIEVLDKDNKPVSGLHLTAQSPELAPGSPDHLFSATNAEGIAVFKLFEGAHSLRFDASKFPENYQLPSPLDVRIIPNAVTRYSIRLIDNKNYLISPTPTTQIAPTP